YSTLWTNLSLCEFFFFFFQAEDGIRDFHVTGVQTCALPISSPCRIVRLAISTSISASIVITRPDPLRGSVAAWMIVPALLSPVKIGRASCRERVEISGVAVSSQNKKRERIANSNDDAQTTAD